MYCNKCGEQIPDGSLFCAYCGDQQNVPQTEAIVIHDAARAEVQQPEPTNLGAPVVVRPRSRKQSRMIWGVIIGIAGLVAGFLALVFFYPPVIIEPPSRTVKPISTIPKTSELPTKSAGGDDPSPKTNTGDMYELGEHEADDLLSSEASEDPEYTQYPGEIARTLEWTDIDNDGYSVHTEVDVYNPVRFEEPYTVSFSESTSVSILKEADFQGRNVWVLPFSVTITNTTEGFDPVKYECYAGVTPNYKYKSGRKNIDFEDFSSRNATLESLLNDTKGGFFWTQCFIDGRTIDEVWNVKIPLELAEGTPYSITGYTLFVDREPTPNNPDGVTSDDRCFNGAVLGLKSVFSVSRFAGPPRWMYPLYSFCKDANGELSFDKEYD